MSILPSSVLSTLQSYLEGQRMAGVQKLPWNDTPPSKRTGQTLPPPVPAPPAPPPPLEKEASPSRLPPAPSAEPVATVVPSKIAWIRATRHPDCPVDPSGEKPALIVISDQEEFQNKPGTLLEEMLYAIGFVRETEPAGIESGIPEDSSRILVMGNKAWQTVSDAGVDLKLIRGFWQSLPQGRSLATYAPSDVTDSPSGKKTVWNDLQSLLEDLQLDIPEWTRKRLKRS